MLLATVQEQQERIEALEKRVNALAQPLTLVEPHRDRGHETERARGA